MPDYFEHFIVMRPNLKTHSEPPYDAKSALAFIRKFVPLLQADSHWLVIADSQTVEYFLKVQTALGATFEAYLVPNHPGFVMFSYPKALISIGEFVRALQEHTPIHVEEEDVIADVLALASSPEAVRVMIGWNTVLQTAKKGEADQPGMGYRCAETALRMTDDCADRARCAHLN